MRRIQNRMATQAEQGSTLRIPLVQEALSVGRRKFETGQGVRVHKTVSEETWRIDDAVLRQQLDIEHVPVNAWVDGELPVQRHEGATLVIPVLEEVLVVEKRVRLKEEIRITPHTHSEPVSSTVVLRTQQAAVERFDEGAGESPDAVPDQRPDQYASNAQPIQRDASPEPPH
jgi:uncharacterized protein (TIGR02271 family)